MVVVMERSTFCTTEMLCCSGYLLVLLPGMNIEL